MKFIDGSTLLQGRIYVKDFIIDGSKYPPVISDGIYRLDLILLEHNETYLVVKVHFRISKKTYRLG